MTWLNTRLVLSPKRWQLLACCLLIGGLFAGSYLLNVKNIGDLSHEREARAQQIVRSERKWVKSQLLTRNQVQAIARRQARLEAPNDADILRAIRNARLVCQRRPQACARASGVVGLPVPPALGSVIPSGSALDPKRESEQPGRSRPKQSPSKRPSERPGTSSGQPPPGDSPSRKPLVGVTTPDTPLPKVPLCLGLIEVDCPGP